MDSDEKSALAAIIIATFTENIKRKKGAMEGLHLCTMETRHSRDIFCFLISCYQFFSFSSFI